MKLFHISDLHLGKRVYEFSMIEDQKYILDQILQLVEQENPDGVLITGDIYDKAVPPVEAVKLLDGFLTALSAKKIFIYVIAGNHDSAQRLDFGKTLFTQSGVCIEGSYGGSLAHAIQEDVFGSVHFYFLPFIKPAMVTSYFEEEVPSYQKAVELVLSKENIDFSQRNILLVHQFVTWKGNAERSDSETYSLGGVDEVDASLFFSFDYTALGHLHGPQRMGQDAVRYAGSPLAYSFSEIHQKKAVTMLLLEEKGKLKISFLPLCPRRPLREIKGPLEKLLEAGKGGSEDYMRAVLTDTKLLYDPLGKLRAIYPNLMTLELEKQKNDTEREEQEMTEAFAPEDLFTLFYEKQNQKEMSPEQKKIAKSIWEGLAGDVE